MLWILAFVLCWVEVRGFCTKNVSIDITSGVNNSGVFLHENVRYPKGSYFVTNGTVQGCICDVKACVKLCCPPGQAKLNFKCTDHDWEPKFRIYEDTNVLENAEYHIEGYNFTCPGFTLEPNELPEDFFYVQKDGSLYLPSQYFRTDRYCLTTFTNESDVLQAHVCLAGNRSAPKYEKQTYGMMLSIPFLLVTLVIYYMMPDKNNIHTKCQMTYVASLMMAYLFLVIMQLSEALSAGVCVTLASFCLYFFISSFCWMNITCIDIFLTFSGMRGFGLSKKSAQLKRFAFYCLYSYGFPLILVAVILGINFNNNQAAWYHPSLGYDKCWIRDGMPELLYFYGPMGALLLCNIVLFILTALKIRQINKDTAMLRKDENKKHYESDKQMFSLYFKLLIAMGINWSLEFISWLVDWLLAEKKIPQIFYVTDLCNALYGLLIFYLFVCKRAIWIMLKKRYYIFMGQPQKARALSTKASNYQTSDTEKTNVDESVTTSKV